MSDAIRHRRDALLLTSAALVHKQLVNDGFIHCQQPMYRKTLGCFVCPKRERKQIPIIQRLTANTFSVRRESQELVHHQFKFIGSEMD